MKMLLISMLTQIQPLGLLNVATCLSEKGHDVSVLFLTLSRPETESEAGRILEFINLIKPHAIGFSLMTLNFQRSARLSEMIKSRFPDILIVWGGIHPTLMPEECLNYADMVCLGEGEEAMLEMAGKLQAGQDYHDTRNFWFNNKTKGITRNELRPYAGDLNKLPFPRWDWDKTYCIDKGSVLKLDLKRYREHAFGRGSKYNVLFSRGCAFDCLYCCNSYFKKLYEGKGPHIRKRGMGHIMQELSYIKKNFSFVSMISIQDDNFLMSQDDFLDEFAYRYKRDIGLPFVCKSFPQSITSDKISKLKEAGLEYIQLGIQASDGVNKRVFGRPSRLEDVLKAGRVLREHGVVGRYDVIVDNPYETEEGTAEILNMLIELPKPYWLQLFSMAFFPSTELAERAKNDGFFTRERSGYLFDYGKPLEAYSNILISVAPRTPRWLMRRFLANRDKTWAKALLKIYNRCFIRYADRFIYRIAVFNPEFAVNIKRLFNRQRRIYQNAQQEE